MSAPVRHTVPTLPGGSKATIVSGESNDETSGPSAEIPPYSILTINVGSLTLAQFVERLEASGQVAHHMFARLRRRFYVMPVTAPEPNVDRFGGRGDRPVEDVLYGVVGRQRLAIHGIIEFHVVYVGEICVQRVNYHF
ncbi:unnamed protein product, partial [Mesorhabditis belari]|uniref:Uncharacterized protein n=1 Tax=Mesorhabditis belari TaxID=2138241 RepID=A0AAF3FG05_9BILA